MLERWPAFVAARHKTDFKNEISGDDRRRKTRQGRPHNHHAKTHYPRKCPPQSQSAMDRKNGLITTDTLSWSALCQRRTELALLPEK